MEAKPINFDALGGVLSIDGGKLHRWYRNVLSGFLEFGQESLHRHDIEVLDKSTGKINKVFVPLCCPENIGDDMCVDEKQIGEDFYTILSNRKTGKLAFVADTTQSLLLFEATMPIREKLWGVKIINRDLASCYRSFCNLAMPEAEQVGDKFHVVKLLLDSQQAVRAKLKKEIDTKKRKAYEAFKKKEEKRRCACEKLGKEYKKGKFIFEEETLSNGETPSELLRRSRYLLYKFPSQWTQNQNQRAVVLFSKSPLLEKAYNICRDFRQWYSKENIGRHLLEVDLGLNRWYNDVEESGIEELMNFKSTVERNENYICNYFYHNGANNAMAENRNGKIKKFISLNQGTRDKDFFFFRLKKYYA